MVYIFRFYFTQIYMSQSSFREDIYKSFLWKNTDNRVKHVINECEKLKTERIILLV